MLWQVKDNQPYQFSEANKYVFGFDCAKYYTAGSLIDTNDIHMAAWDREINECANGGGPA